MTYNKSTTRLADATPDALLGALGAVLLVLALLVYKVAGWVPPLAQVHVALLIAGVLALAVAGVLHLTMTDSARIRHMVRQALFCPAYGNPLHLKEGELLPRVRCKAVKVEDGSRRYVLTIWVKGGTVEEVKALSSFISSSLVGRYQNYAVIAPYVDLAYNHVDFVIEDVTIDRRMVVHDVEEMRPVNPTVLSVQQGTTIDLTTSGSMIVAGKTCSGKTTGIISLILQVLLHGPDRYGSKVTIIDPKQAELSRLPGVVTLDEDGKARAILAAMRDFAELITRRQAVLNELSEESGDAVHWWDADMHVALLFIDEFVSCRSLFPKRADKDDPDYCVAEFDAVLKRIVTMGASAGCYVIISIAEASVEEGGLPAMLRAAMSTRILFRPTMPEAKLLWSSAQLETMLERTYGPGDAWYSSTDGVHDEVSLVRFPKMDFPLYQELGRLLREYKTSSDATPSGAEA